ncbi:hypothetical protein DFQ27_007145 [Actinomortierella ambigua]|uniref:Uncharacterized protein n=1 Tax=Actinomortierella ambigua TaxID=1343610 RepID=A0A9P6QIY4_9FUNG|nr:hypothetical protein DFQ27_007145 [Actinomortierella ambigua]
MSSTATNPHPSDHHQHHPAGTTTTTATPTSTAAPAKQSTMDKVKDKAYTLVEKMTGKPPGQHLHHDPLHSQAQAPTYTRPTHAPGGGTAAAGGAGGGHGGAMAALANDYNAAPATKTDAHGHTVLNTMPAPVSNPDPTASTLTRVKNDILHPDDPTRPHTDRHIAEMSGGTTTVHPATAAIPTAVAMGGIPAVGGVGGAPHQQPHHQGHTATTTGGGPTGHKLAHDSAAEYHAGRTGVDTRHVTGDGQQQQHHQQMRQHPHDQGHAAATTAGGGLTGHGLAHDSSADYHAGRIGVDARHDGQQYQQMHQRPHDQGLSATTAGTTGQALADPTPYYGAGDAHHRGHEDQMQQHLSSKPLPVAPSADQQQHLHQQQQHHHHGMAPAGPTGTTAVPAYTAADRSHVAAPMHAQEGTTATSTVTTSSLTSIPSSVTGHNIEVPTSSAAVHHLPASTVTSMPGSLPTTEGHGGPMSHPDAHSRVI